MKIHGIANVMTGVSFLIVGIAMMWLLSTVGVAISQAFASLGAITGNPTATSQVMGFFSNIMAAGWIFSIISLLTGVANLISGALLIRKH